MPPKSGVYPIIGMRARELEALLESLSEDLDDEEYYEWLLAAESLIENELDIIETELDL